MVMDNILTLSIVVLHSLTAKEKIAAIFNQTTFDDN